MTLITIKNKLQKSAPGRLIIGIYHYCIAIPLTYYYQIKYKIKRSSFKDIQFYPDSIVFEMLKDKGFSLCRFGDGEIAWIYRDSKGYFGQENPEQLSNRLKEVLLSNDDKILVGIPKFFDEMQEYDERRRKSRNVHLAKYGERWMELLDEQRKYADALISRVYLGRDCDHKMMFDGWKSIWNNKDVIIVEGKDTRFGAGNTLLDNAKSIRRILVPSENAFASYQNILETTLLYRSSAIFLLAIGPTATVLAFDLAKEGCQAIDIGHLDIEYEWYLRKVKTKVAIQGKYVNEISGQKVAESKEVDQKYLNQIIAKCYE